MNITTDVVLDADYLLNRLAELGQVGDDLSEGGRTRIALTNADKAGRDLLCQWMQALGLVVRIDQIGNVIGLLPIASGSINEPLMMGSHIDTVRHAGALDGCYGVVAGLAVIKAYRDAGCLPERPIAVVAFTNEEGVRYQPDMMGSLVYAGGLSVEDALATKGTDGSRLGDELARIGYDGAVKPGQIQPAEYLELHIEQGPILEAEQLQIGVVENLQGISWQKITISGQANHAGTTPMYMRHDAGWVAASIHVFLNRLATESDGRTLATIGSLTLEPNLINVIPRKAILTVDLRDPDELRLQAAEHALKAFLQEIAQTAGVVVETEQLVRFNPVKFDDSLANQIEATTEALGFTYRRMTSGAGHDAQMMARLAPSAMIFVPSKGGVSHNPREHTDAQDLINGANVLLSVVTQRVGAHALIQP
ncbi:Zn-dependent hydrolase [Leeia sp. TBRC 13508]|uniref:Zn-dependent hydrolase n=1 Tax=Leeia speluncae TaxID=2884804 RepID=A0ABS8DA36_9NEIS|nr:Zn-dependent hydrolase [Leeia speluncae]MCB6185070.1 Zn-dependent hydrolase [Leeia speluncae]